jgi:hypothetical protein
MIPGRFSEQNANQTVPLGGPHGTFVSSWPTSASARLKLIRLNFAASRGATFEWKG